MTGPTSGIDSHDGHVPGQHELGGGVAALDAAIDDALERVRGNPLIDRVFTTASHVGDFSLIWHAINLARSAHRRSLKSVVLFAALLGVESLIVNQGIKRLFRRSRPTPAGNQGLSVRQPSTSSFPSGHASSATFASSLLASRDGTLLSIVWYSIAGIVGTSRAYVRIHHASDVLAGIVTGRVLASIAKRALRRFGLFGVL